MGRRRPWLLALALAVIFLLLCTCRAEDTAAVAVAPVDAAPSADLGEDYANVLAAGESELTKALHILDNSPSAPFADVVALIHRSSRKGNAEALFYLGLLHAYGLGVVKSDAKAITFYTMAALSGSSEASVVLAHKYERGLGVPQNTPKAVSFAKCAAEKVAKTYKIEHRQRVPAIILSDYERQGKRAATSISGISEDTLVQSHVYRSEQGSMESRMVLGYTYLYGLYSQDIDVPKAMRHFEDALAKKHPQAYGALGQIYMQGMSGPHHIAVDQEKAFRLFEAGQDLGDPVSLNGLGYFYARSATLRVTTQEQEERFKKAGEYYSRSAALGNADGTYNLAVLRLHGKGVAKDPDNARSLFQVASGKGSVLASWQLGLLSLLGDAGMPQSDANALRFFKDVMGKGQWHQHLKIAFGAYTAGNDRVALVEYLMAAEMGLSTSKANALHILHNRKGLDGVNVVRHAADESISEREKLVATPQEAVLLSRSDAIDELILTIILRSALEGDRTALLRLGDHYYERGNYSRAMSCYQQASAGGGLPQAMFNLGLMYQHGLGTSGGASDFSSAKRYFDATLERSNQVSDGDAYYAVQGALFVLNFHYWLHHFHFKTGVSPPSVAPATGMPASVPSGLGWRSVVSVLNVGLPRPFGYAWDDWLLGVGVVSSLVLLLLRNQVADDGR